MLGNEMPAAYRRGKKLSVRVETGFWRAALRRRVADVSARSFNFAPAVRELWIPDQRLLYEDLGRVGRSQDLPDAHLLLQPETCSKTRIERQ